MPTSVQDSQLGKMISYTAEYQPDHLFPMPRQEKRAELNIHKNPPFAGFDIWNAYEISWLNAKGKPMVSIGQFIIPCTSPNIIESKSFKLYLNSFNNTRFPSINKVIQTLQQDISHAVGADITLHLSLLSQYHPKPLTQFSGVCLDLLDIEVEDYTVNPSLLTLECDNVITETLYSDLLKSNCLMTGQPDWASIKIQYTGPTINHHNLLKYIISYRNHNEFHEQCIERIFMDIAIRCKPQQLTVEACYTRRGGIDINPIRTTETFTATESARQYRQ